MTPTDAKRKFGVIAKPKPKRDQQTPAEQQMAQRLRHVRVCCGDWRPVLGPAAITHRKGNTAIFLDPTYGRVTGRQKKLYLFDSLTVAGEVRDWAVDHGNKPGFRIALCGGRTEHQMPSDWTRYEWVSRNGFLESIWVNPICL